MTRPERKWTILICGDCGVECDGGNDGFTYPRFSCEGPHRCGIYENLSLRANRVPNEKEIEVVSLDDVLEALRERETDLAPPDFAISTPFTDHLSRLYGREE